MSASNFEHGGLYPKKKVRAGVGLKKLKVLQFQYSKEIGLGP